VTWWSAIDLRIGETLVRPEQGLRMNARLDLQRFSAVMAQDDFQA